MASSKPISELDFDTIKEELKDFLRSQSQFADYDYESSTMSVILDVLAYNTFINNFYTNMAISEMFLDSAQLRSSIMSHAKELNYLPQSYRASRAKINLLFSPDDDPSTISIPKYTKFTTSLDGTSYTFTTDSAYEVGAEDGIYSISNVEIYEGRIEREYYNVTGNNTFLISSSKVDTTSINIRVYETNQAGSDYDEYTYRQNLFNVGSNDKVFYINPTQNNKYEVHFGNNVFGREPIQGEVVEIIYRISSGTNPNGSSVFSPSSTISGYEATVTTESNASGGSEMESTESIRFNAPKSIQIQNRVVTESDYTNLLKSQFSEIQSVAVVGGEKFDPPMYGKVVVMVDTNIGDGISNNNKNKYYNFLKDKTSLSIEPVIMSAGFMYIDLDTTVYYNNEKTSKSPDSIEGIVRNAIQNYSNTFLNAFNKNARYSRIVRNIDDSDDSIVSNDTRIRMIYDFVPTINENSSASIRFENQLSIDSHPLTLGEDITKHSPAIKSSSFTYNGDTCYIQDDGNGILAILTNTSSGFRIVENNIGTVNYTTGKTIIRNLNVENYTGNAIKIYARTENRDFIAPKDRILAIRNADVKVTVQIATN